MGQIKNIKLHIVTDIKDVRSMKNVIEECWQSDSTSRPETETLLCLLKVMLEEMGRSMHTSEVTEKTALNSNCDLYFKVRDEVNNEAGETSHSLLMNCVS